MMFLLFISEDLPQNVVDLKIWMKIQNSDLVSLSKNPPDLLSLSKISSKFFNLILFTWKDPKSCSFKPPSNLICTLLFIVSA
ncbi:hypothetical protein QVD17_24355 [Tagetes erecta]|uniref:Uncharacterized protein n=1 Tax=Tagetes erecta TaxID=13708 RepID=A0AAD8NMQ2_TARER|nr:hypothetical protein QVD17_24355 [Tagetes erecta]